MSKTAVAGANEFQMISWREDPAVYDEACRMSKEMGPNKQTTFSKFFRNGITMEHVFGEVSDWLATKRLNQATSQLEQTCATIYPVSPIEIVTFVIDAVHEKMAREGAVTAKEELIG